MSKHGLADRPPTEFTAHLLHQAHQHASDITTQALRAYGLTVRQYTVLSVLRSAEPTAQSALIQKTGIDRSTMADMLTRMGQRELVVSDRIETDQRANLVTITPKGLRAFNAALPKVVEAEERILKQLSNEQQGLLLETLTTLITPSRK